MEVLSITAPTPGPTSVRCECGTCGAHVEATMTWRLAGWCQNCGGYDLRPLEQAQPRLDLPPAVTPHYRAA